MTKQYSIEKWRQLATEIPAHIKPRQYYEQLLETYPSYWVPSHNSVSVKVLSCRIGLSETFVDRLRRCGLDVVHEYRPTVVRANGQDEYSQTIDINLQLPIDAKEPPPEKLRCWHSPDGKEITPVRLRPATEHEVAIRVIGSKRAALEKFQIEMTRCGIGITYVREAWPLHNGQWKKYLYVSDDF